MEAKDTAGQERFRTLTSSCPWPCLASEDPCDEPFWDREVLSRSPGNHPLHFGGRKEEEEKTRHVFSKDTFDRGYDCTQRSSFEHVKFWQDEVRKCFGSARGSET